MFLSFRDEDIGFYAYFLGCGLYITLILTVVYIFQCDDEDAEVENGGQWM